MCAELVLRINHQPRSRGFPFPVTTTTLLQPLLQTESCYYYNKDDDDCVSNENVHWMRGNATDCSP